ncbi:hypothetical protein B0T21DRAFT_348608 [Apiosordaria backusii]|uniref:Uncharacterized protein n=1 Tax=Apiosordaria backusii TaxID=314023 RepID=A0AA40EHV4_9PEZI|nr:hypothetical protein B0T21DRAFT_348608 [Apiosordaria backusii]
MVRAGGLYYIYTIGFLVSVAQTFSSFQSRKRDPPTHRPLACRRGCVFLDFNLMIKLNIIIYYNINRNLSTLNIIKKKKVSIKIFTSITIIYKNRLRKGIEKVILIYNKAYKIFKVEKSNRNIINLRFGGCFILYDYYRDID